MTIRTPIIVAIAAMLVAYTHPVFADMAKGRAALEAGNYGVAKREFEEAVGDGNYQGRYWIGLMYEYGYGLPRDPQRAFKMTRDAAEHSMVLAERRLGEMYRDGYGVIQDFAKARKWLDEAATDGDVLAQRELGELYARTTDIPADPARAYAWLDIAARSGDQSAIDRRAKLAKSMKPDDIKVATDLARDFAATIAVRPSPSSETKK